MKYFIGEAQDLGHVTALPSQTWPELLTHLTPVRLTLTREQFESLPKRDKNAPLDRERAKRVRYITPAAFRASPSARRTEEVTRCNLIALDIDNSSEAKRLLSQKWDACLGDLGYIVWHTASSTATAPRLRVLVNAEGIPSSRYTQAVRTIAELIGLTAVTSESRVMVQPMYFPTVFADTTDAETPIVAVNAQGDAFRVADIIDDQESTFVDGPTAGAGTVELADLEFLKLPIDGITAETAKEALSFIDPDIGMQQWIEIAAGLKHQFGEDGFALWNEWSAKGKKYEGEEEAKYRWGTLKGNPADRMPVTMRSVFKIATARGWTNQALASRHHQETMAWIKSPSRSGEELLDKGAKKIAQIGPVLGTLERKTLLVALRDKLDSLGLGVPLPDLRNEVRRLEMDVAKTTGLAPWAKGICYVTALNLFYRYTTDRFFAPEVLDLMYTTPPTGDDKPMRPRDYLIQVATVPQVENLRYEPAKGAKRFFTEGGVPYVNTYRPDYPAPDSSRAEEAGEIYWDHLSKLIRERDHQVILTDFFAYMVQHPGKKVRWAPLIQGGEGCGKSTLAVIMATVLGRRNVAKINGKSVLEGAYNEWAYGKQLVTLEEVRIVGTNKHAVMDGLKPLITDDLISLSQKYQDHRTVPNITNYLLFTNHHDSLAIREDGRRYFVLSSPLQQPDQIAAIGGNAHFQKVYAMIRDNAAGLRAWFEQWKISPMFQPEGRAPVTQFLFELAENSASPLSAIVRHTIDDEPHPLVRKDLVSLSCLRGAMDTTNIPPFSDQALANVMRELGWAKHSRIFVDGSKHQIWVKRDFPDIREEIHRRVEWL
jgi:hypothetical protein